MNFTKPTAELYFPDTTRTLASTHLAIGAHQDDLEIMAFHGIVECFHQPNKCFTGVVVTNGGGSPRDDLYKDYTDEEMMAVRRLEQKKAAVVGEFNALALLDFTSAEVKDAANSAVIEDIGKILNACRPETVYTHNLADKHDTHIGVVLRTIAAIRAMPREARPKRLLGCEVWRDLDWMIDTDKVTLDVSAHDNLAMALVAVFDSQICGGKRYDLATMGRRRAHATYSASHGVDAAEQITFAMDLSPLILDDALDPLQFVLRHIQRFADDVCARVERFSAR